MCIPHLLLQATVSQWLHQKHVAGKRQVQTHGPAAVHQQHPDLWVGAEGVQHQPPIRHRDVWERFLSARK